MDDVYKLMEPAPAEPVDACPCCGSRARVWEYVEKPGADVMRVVMCDHNSGIGPRDSMVYEGCLLQMPTTDFYRGRGHEAVRYWNDYAKALTATRRVNCKEASIDQAKGEDAIGMPLGDALRRLRHVESHRVEAIISALVTRWPAFDLAAYLRQFRVASEYANGPGLNTGHLAESRLTYLTRALQTPELQRNWLDLITLAIDGAQRAGATQADIITYLDHALTLLRNRAASISVRDPYEQTDHTARHTDVASREV